MSLLSLSLTLLFVFVPFILSKTLNLNLEKDIVVATVRSVVQLFAIGYVLQFIFEAEGFLFIGLMVIFMLTVATLNARKKGKGIKGITWKIAVTLTTVEVFTQGILLGLNIVPATPQYIIPISGMLIGNAMVITILFLNRFKAEMAASEDQIELILSLGGTPKQAIHKQLVESIKTSIIPTIEAQKTIGLVQLPGMMSGQIIGGADPVQAVQFQILIIFGLLTCAALSSILLGFLIYPTFFNERMQKLAWLEQK